MQTPRWANAYFSLLAAATLCWWGALWIRPDVRDLFFRREDQGWMWAFLVPDVLVYVALALAATRSRVLLALHTGGVLYVTSLTIGYAAMTGSGWLGALLMAPTPIVPAWLLARSRR